MKNKILIIITAVVIVIAIVLAILAFGGKKGNGQGELPKPTTESGNTGTERNSVETTEMRDIAEENKKIIYDAGNKDNAEVWEDFKEPMISDDTGMCDEETTKRITSKYMAEVKKEFTTILNYEGTTDEWMAAVKERMYKPGKKDKVNMEKKYPEHIAGKLEEHKIKSKVVEVIPTAVIVTLNNTEKNADLCKVMGCVRAEMEIDGKNKQTYLVGFTSYVGQKDGTLYFLSNSLGNVYVDEGVHWSKVLNEPVYESEIVCELQTFQK